jgi:hypothetical protein
MAGTVLFRILFLLLAGFAAGGAFAFVWSITPERNVQTAAVTPPPAEPKPAAPAGSQTAALPPPAASSPGTSSEKPAAAPAPQAAADETPPAFDVARIEASGEAVIAGRAAPGAVVELLQNGQVHDRTTADGAGEFVLVPPPLPPGNYELTLRVTLANGRQLTSKESVTVAIAESRKEKPVVALTAPNQPSRVLSKPAPPDAGSTPAPTAVAIDAVEAEAGGRLHVTGRAAAAVTVRLYLNETYLAQATAAADGRVAFTIAGGVVAGDYRVRLDEVDPASGKVRSRA